MVRMILAICLILYDALSLAGTIDPNTPDSKYVEYAKNFDYVVQIIGKKDDNSDFTGSAVAYDKNLILTAAHLFHRHKSSSIKCGTKVLTIKRYIQHKDYDYDKFGQHDIAICLVDGDIGLNWYPNIYTDNKEQGKVCSLAGYGCTGTFKTGVIIDLGCAKRAGSNVVDAADRFMLSCSPSGILTRTELEMLIAIGDSGGGLFIGNELAGIHSGIIEDKPNKGKSKYGAVSMHTRVSLYQEWIRSTALTLQNE